MSDLDRFELFTYVAQADSLTQAAKLLDMTKASLSKQIKRLEADLKIDLFSRSGQRLRLTPQGEILLQQTLRLKRELEDARSVCQQFHEEPEGTLKVIAFPYFASKLIFPRLKQFLQRYPKLKVIIDTSERMPDFEKEQVDLVVGISLSPPDREDILRASLGTTYYALCGTEEYFIEYGKPKTLQDLTRHRIISHTARGTEYIKLKPDYSVVLKPYLVLSSIMSMIDCAKAGVGLIQLPMYLLEELLADGTLISVLDEFQRADEPIYYYYPKYRYVQPKVRKFIDFFLKPL